MKWLSILVLALFACTGLLAADLDAQTPPDPRLDQKVTLSVDHAQLDSALKQLSDKTKVAFKAGSNDRDWRVREQHVTIRVKEMPLKSVMEQITKLLGFRVTRGGKAGEWDYLFWQDKKARDLEEDMVASAKEAAAQRSQKMRQGAIDDAEKALNMSQDDALKLKDKDPWLAYMGGTTAGRGFSQIMSALGGSSPTDLDLMLRGKRMSLSFDGMSAGIGSAAAATTQGGIFGALRRGAPGMPNIPPSGMTIMPIGDMGGAGAGMLGFGGMAFITGKIPGMGSTPGNPFGDSIPMSMFPICKSDSLIGKAFGKMLFALDDGASLQDAMGKIQSDMTSDPDFLANAVARESVTEQNPPTDPELTREVELAGVFKDYKLVQDPKKMKEDQAKAIDEIARATGYTMMVESFNTSLPITLFLKAGKQPVWKILAGLEKGGYTWTKDGGVLRVRPEDWALLRSYAIPEDFMTMCRTTLTKQGAFGLDDLAYIATSLSDDQIQNTLIAEPDLTMAVATLATPIMGGREVLRVYGSLNAQQKASLTSPQGLRFAQFNAPQWDRLSALITDRLGGIYITDGAMRLKIEDTSKLKGAQAAAGTGPAGAAGMGMLKDMKVAMFEVNVLSGDDQKPRTVSEMVTIMGKSGIAALQQIQKDALAAADKAGKPKPATPPAPKPVPIRKPQPAK